MANFAAEFFYYYDKKIAAGEIKFSELGLDKDDFTKLCTQDGYALTREQTEELCKRMKLTEEESKGMLEEAIIPVKKEEDEE